MKRALVVLVLGVIPALTGAAADRQAPAVPPQFRAGIELVTIDVVATGRDGAPVRHLTAQDFEVFENGVAIPITAFQFVDLTAVDAGPALPPGIVSNDAEPGGLFAIVIDEMGVQVTDVQQVRRVAERFLQESLLPQDHVAVVRANADSGFFLAADRTLALDTVSRSIGRLDRGLRLDDPDMIDGPTTIADDRERGDGGKGGFQVLAGVIERLRPIPARRKAILWFSRGSTLPEDPFETLEEGKSLGRSERDFVAMIDAARAANVAIYTVDPRGLIAPANADQGAGVGRPGEDLGTLRDLASATGGRALVNNNDLNGLLTQVAIENRAYYLLGYSPPESKNRRPRRISIRTRVDGVRLLHRLAYVPPEPGTKAPAVDLIASPLPVRDLPIAMAPAVVLLGRDRYGIVVPFEAGKDVADDAQVSYTVAALDAAGKVVGQTNGRAKAKGGRISAVARLAVRGSTLQIRVAATAEGSEARGLAFATARVPDGPSTLPWCGGFALEQAGAAPALREFSANRLLTMTVIVSADTLDGAPLAFALGAPGRPAERSFPIEAGRALSRGVWQFSLELKPPLPRGWVDVVLHRDGAPLGEGCKTAFRLE